ncbi:hypothetical protein AMTRI_Chr10g227910 [Amborella trichopoda]
MFVSEAWKGSKWSMEVKGKRVYNIQKATSNGHILKAMDVAREEIKHNLKQGEKGFGPILKIVHGKWDLQLERPETPTLGRVRDSIMVAFNKCKVRLYTDSDVQDKLSTELDLYSYSMGTIGMDFANHGKTAPNMQKMAQWILNLTCTSSDCNCNCNFSTFEMYNQKLKEHHLDWFQIEDPILVKELDPTSEWLVKPNVGYEHVFKGESLTWTRV